MPRYREVPSLQFLCLRAVGALVVSMVPRILSNICAQSDTVDSAILRRHISQLEQLLVSSVPRYLYNSMAKQVLVSVKELISKTMRTFSRYGPTTAFLREMKVVVSLTEVVLNRHLKVINISSWPKMMRYVLYTNLNLLTGVEILDLGSCMGEWKTNDNERRIMDGIMGMKNLRSLCLCFDANDTLIQVSHYLVFCTCSLNHLDTLLTDQNGEVLCKE